MADEAKVDSAKDADLGQIREIIFGRQMRDYEERFTQLHEDVVQTTGEVRSALETRLTKVQTLLDDGSKDARANFGDVRKEIQALRKEHEARLGDLDEAVDRLRADCDANLKALRDELTAAAVEAEARWTQRANQLDADKLDRRVLAQLLADVARQIDGNDAS